MKVVLLKDVPKVGKKGDVKDFADGYAKNFLISKKLAVSLQDSVGKDLAQKNQDKTSKKVNEISRAQKIKAKVESRTLHFDLVRDKSGKSYGSITQKNIQDQILAKHGIELDNKVFKEHVAFKEPGKYTIPIFLEGNTKAEIKLTIQ